MAQKTAVITEKKINHRKNFVKTFEKISYKYAGRSVWYDFVYMCATALSQPIDFRQDREDEYLRKINAYGKDEQNLFPEMLGELTFVFEDERFGDILGEIYSSLGMTNAKNGQFFTPYNVCKMMAAMQTSKERLPAEIEQKGYITVNDPCCGAGALLIAFAEQCMECGVNYQNSILFVAQDIDPTAALMCYVQMALLGMPGYVIIGNTLSNHIPEAESIWYTPMYFLHGFQYRTQTVIYEENGIESGPNDIVRQPETQAVIIPVTDMDIVLRETESGQFTFDMAG